jgi:hypothetical protein
MTLMKPILNRGHLLGLDNFYTDLVLFMHLVANGTGAVGTARHGRRCFPKKLINKYWADIEKGRIRVRYFEDFFCMNWRDKKDVIILSTVDSPEKVDSISSYGREFSKPRVVHLYNKTMPGVDMSEQKRHARKVARDRVKRWYKKMISHFIDVSLVNAHIICSKYVPGLENIKPADFRIDVVRQIFEKHPYNNANEAREPRVRNLGRLVGSHTRIGRGSQRECVVCRKNGNRVRTNYFCERCEVALCIVDCYDRYHTVEEF